MKKKSWMMPDAFYVARRQLDSWGFIGTYNFFYMPPATWQTAALSVSTGSNLSPRKPEDVSEGWGGRCVFINFIDQAMRSTVHCGRSIMG